MFSSDARFSRHCVVLFQQLLRLRIYVEIASSSNSLANLSVVSSCDRGRNKMQLVRKQRHYRACTEECEHLAV